MKSGYFQFRMSYIKINNMLFYYLHFTFELQKCIKIAPNL